MTRLGPRTGPTAGPRQGPNAAVGGEVDPVGPSQTFTAEPGDNFIYVAPSGYLTGTGPFRLTTTGTLPAGLSRGVDYWTIVTNGSAPGDTFKLALSEALAIAETEVAITDTGSGVHTIVYVGDDPLVGYSSAFTVVAGDSFVVLAVAGPTFLDGPFRLSTTGSLPTGLLAGTDYWIADSFTGDSQTFQISDSLANAMTATYVAIDVDDGTGTHTITYVG